MQTEADTQRLHELEIRLQGLASLAVAFSGGVDSSFLLAVAEKIKPKKLLAVTVASEFVPSREIEAAKKTASLLKVDHICLSADILGNEEVVQNTEERCYHCKKQIFSLIRSAADDLGIKTLLHGVNLDDLKDFRPGLKAADELGFLSPLAEIGFTKKMIRENARLLGLETWNKPSQSCLATRIPYHVRIQKPDLIRVDRSEAFLRKLGFAQVRVRCHGKTAVLEVE
ncbi:MAG: TIGR00268 family protein, partial [Deltaproteobacteria bacterium RIFOXYC2_FULL_48_10]